MRALSLIPFLLVAGCVTPAPEADPAGETAPATEAAARVELRLDEPVSVEDLEVRWLEVADSRCPRGAQCVWEGQVSVTLEVLASSSTLERLVLTLPAGTEPTAREAFGKVFRLVDVKPHPLAGVTLKRDQLVATVEVRPA